MKVVEVGQSAVRVKTDTAPGREEKSGVKVVADTVVAQAITEKGRDQVGLPAPVMTGE